MDPVAPQQYERTLHRRDFGVLSFGSLRITVSTLDLDDSTKYCTTAGGTSPDFTGNTVTCTAADVFTADKKSILLNNVLPAATAKLSTMLQVDQSTANIVVPTNLCSRVTKPAAHSTTGVSNTDFVLYVSAGPTSGSTMAWASYCTLDQYHRPIAGVANFGPSYISWSSTSSSSNAELVATAVHEMLHALGFSQTFYMNYFVGGTSTTVTRTMRGKTVTLLTTPYVASVTRTFFGCDTLEGAEMEDEGGSGSAMSHWDRRMYRDELMAAAGGTYFSVVTLAYFKDTGLYNVNFNTAEAMAFGASAGCGFLTTKCNTVTGGKDTFWCFDEKVTSACTFDKKGIGYCNVQTDTTALPSYFQYFSNPLQGGPLFVDRCPYIQPYSNRICTDTVTTTTEDLRLGYAFGSNSRCITTSGGSTSSTGLVQQGLVSSGSPYRCLLLRCPNGVRLEIQIGGSTTWLQCPVDGSAGSINPPSGYVGLILCPAASSICDASISTGTFTTTTVPPVTVGTAVSTTTAATVTAPPTTTAVGTTATPTTTETPRTVAPIATVPTSDLKIYQLVTYMALAQITSSVKSALEAELVRVLNNAATVSVSSVIVGTGTLQGGTIIRISAGSLTLSQATMLNLLALQVANTSSSLVTTYRLVQSKSVTVVPDCTLVCSANGTASAYRNDENTACGCTCKNQFVGTYCSTCPARYSGALCNMCASGLVGYPSCTTQSTCDEPVTPRYSEALTTTCSAAIRSTVILAESACAQVQCSCLGGAIDSGGTCRTSQSSSLCQELVCAGKRRECKYQYKLARMREVASDCSGDLTAYMQGALVSRQWCVFDACIDSRLNCPADTVAAACSDNQTVYRGSSASRSRSSLVACVVASLLFAVFAAL